MAEATVGVNAVDMTASAMTEAATTEADTTEDTEMTTDATVAMNGGTKTAARTGTKAGAGATMKDAGIAKD